MGETYLCFSSQQKLLNIHRFTKIKYNIIPRNFYIIRDAPATTLLSQSTNKCFFLPFLCYKTGIIRKHFHSAKILTFYPAGGTDLNKTESKFEEILNAFRYLLMFQHFYEYNNFRGFFLLSATRLHSRRGASLLIRGAPGWGLHAFWSKLHQGRNRPVGDHHDLLEQLCKKRVRGKLTV